MIKLRFAFIIIISLLLISLLSCSDNTPANGTSEKSYDEQYIEAILDAKIAEPYEISYTLTSIVYHGNKTVGEGNLNWKIIDGKPYILMSTWNKYPDSYKVTGNIDTAKFGDMWLTAVPEMKDFFRERNYSGESLHLRVAQLLGMPADSRNDWFAEIWVKPSDLFRPSPDPEIDDHEAQLYFSANVSQQHIDWINNEIQGKYDLTSSGRFPWTRLGYTYDWGNQYEHFGLSEFVLPKGMTYIVESCKTTEEYINRTN